MNIFAVADQPEIAANQLCLKHVCKMVVESTQMLCSAFPENTPNLPYARTHYNHPCAVWTRQTLGNFNWLMIHAMHLADRFARVYNHQHKCKEMLFSLSSIANNLDRSILVNREKTPFPLVMPDRYKIPLNRIASYRNYYIHEKASFAKWESLERIPPWWPFRTNAFVRISR